MLHVAVSVGQRFDRIFYPELNSDHSLCPLVVVGNPRSGTTYLQRSLIDLGFGKGQTLLHQLAPSRVLQHLLRPMSEVLENASPTRHHDRRVYEGGFRLWKPMMQVYFSASWMACLCMGFSGPF